MKNKFLNRLDNINLPAEFIGVLEVIKNFLSSDADLNQTFIIDGYRVGFCRIGESASMIVSYATDVEDEYPILVSGF